MGAGTIDCTATGLYALATTKGALSIVAVIGSLYPVVTVLLARTFLAERIRPIQQVGVVAALAGVAMIAAG
jgi:drug/metabolite transporter (DMT)-like permease